MALMDDLKKRTEEGLKTLKETAGEIAFNVERQARIAKRKMDILKVQRKIQKLYAEIGEYVYGEFTMERPLTLEAPFLAERMASVSDMKSEIREIESEIEEMRKAQPPVKSGD
jgi:vacuolar-type H+-ATPase subunit I/STV1